MKWSGRFRFWLSLALLAAICQWNCPGLAADSENTLRVVMDDNYPPYVFRNQTGALEGILVDQWKLWEEKTGVAVKIFAGDWGESIEAMRQGQFDVIDTIFISEERQRFLDFSQPYATLDVAIFFHRNISGINGIDSLKGFRVGVKRGDYITNLLRQRGITDLVEMGSYEAMIQAAQNQQLVVFVMDKPPALYYLYKLGLDKEFRYSPAIHTGEFHRAVRKGDSATLTLVEHGFAMISSKEYAVIEERWQGTPLLRRLGEAAGGALVAVAVLLAILALWSMMLRRSVSRKTLELNHYIAALEKSENRLRGLFDHMQSGFSYYQLIFDADGTPVDARFLEANKAYEALFRFRGEELIGRRMTEVFPDAAGRYQEVLRIVNRVVNTGTPVTFERFSPSYHLWIRYSLYSPETGYLAVLSENVTDARRAEETIRESVARYRAIMQQSSDAIAIIDLQHRCLLEVNDRWLTMLGYEPEDIKDRLADEFFVEPTETIEQMVKEVVQQGATVVTLHRNRHKNGQIIEVERSAAVIRFSGKKVLMVVDRDVSAQRRLQRQLTKDLMLAADVQRGLLPDCFSDAVFRVETIYEPFHVVSGDFYDYAWDYRRNRFCGLLLDVVGHGVASSLQTLAVSVLYRQIAEKSMGLAEKLKWMNRHMLQYFPEDMYAAALIFEFDIKDHTLHYATAGIYGFLSDTDALPTWNTSPGSLLGIDAAPEYYEHQLPVQNGDAFYFLSDGIQDLLPNPARFNTTDFTATVSSLRQLVAGNERRDDCSAICIRVGGERKFPLQMIFRKEKTDLDKRWRLHQMLRRLTGEEEPKVCVALGEAIMNGMQYGTEVRIRINVIGEWLLLRVRDNGPGFAGRALVARYTNDQSLYRFEEHLLEEHGRGIPIMLAWTDRVIYNREGTEVLLVKHLNRDRDVPDEQQKGV